MSYARPSLSQVVPFSQRSGVLEWCSGTVPIGEFLVDPQKGAHGRFRPRDWTNLACRKKMMVSAELLSLHAAAGVCIRTAEVCRGTANVQDVSARSLTLTPVRVLSWAYSLYYTV